MKWVIDNTGRFGWRPYYDRDELDAECERMVSNFLTAKYGGARFPISTDDLSVMIEQVASDLDLYADLSREGEDVEGLTDFLYRKKPAVRIAQELSLESSRDKRLRTTLAHEYGHVRFHAFLWDSVGQSRGAAEDLARKLSTQSRKMARLRSKFSSVRDVVDRRASDAATDKPFPAVFRSGPRCTWSRMIDAPVSDWMEWQASYVSGAVLMPVSFLRSVARKGARRTENGTALSDNSSVAAELVARVAETFDVSVEAARVRLVKVGILQETREQEH